MRGVSLSQAYGPDELALIFFKIRTTRDRATRRSLQRRARIALSLIPGLTDAERHEVAAVWSQRDQSNIDSPAIRKLQGDERKAYDWETIAAKRYTRRATGVKKPGIPRLGTVAANDATYQFPGSRQFSVYQRTLF